MVGNFSDLLSPYLSINMIIALSQFENGYSTFYEGIFKRIYGVFDNFFIASFSFLISSKTAKKIENAAEDIVKIIWKMAS